MTLVSGRPGARLEHRERLLCDVGANGGSGVAAVTNLGKILSVVVDELVGAEVPKPWTQSSVGCARYADTLILLCHNFRCLL
jgi:hypothetical protein